jgi:hypothetical protein
MVCEVAKNIDQEDPLASRSRFLNLDETIRTLESFCRTKNDRVRNSVEKSLETIDEALLDTVLSRLKICAGSDPISTDDCFDKLPDQFRRLSLCLLDLQQFSDDEDAEIKQRAQKFLKRSSLIIEEIKVFVERLQKSTNRHTRESGDSFMARILPPPIARILAIPERPYVPGMQVILDGSASRDAMQRPLRFSWMLKSKDGYEILGEPSSMATFALTIRGPGKYHIVLDVAAEVGTASRSSTESYDLTILDADNGCTKH